MSDKSDLIAVLDLFLCVHDIYNAHKTAHRVIFESSSLLLDRATINVFSAVSRASSYYGSPLRCVISLKFCRFYAGRISRISVVATFFSMLSVFELCKGFFIRMRKNTYTCSLTFQIPKRIYNKIHEIKAKSPLEKFIALYII